MTPNLGLTPGVFCPETPVASGCVSWPRQVQIWPQCHTLSLLQCRTEIMRVFGPAGWRREGVLFAVWSNLIRLIRISHAQKHPDCYHIYIWNRSHSCLAAYLPQGRATVTKGCFSQLTVLHLHLDKWKFEAANGLTITENGVLWSQTQDDLRVFMQS